MKDQAVVLPTEVAKIAESVSVEKRDEVQAVLNQVFNGVAKMREQLDSVIVSSEDDKVNMKLANTIRLGVRQVRLEAERSFDAKRTEVQQQMSSYKTEDSLWLKSKQTMQILTKEIEANALWKEETKKRFEAEAKELKVQQRIIEVNKYTELERLEFENMSDESFLSFLSGLEATHKAKIEAEQKIEADRLAKEKAEKEAIENQRLENEKLKADAIKKQAAQDLIDEERIEKARLEYIKARELEAKNNAILKAEREAKSKLEEEIKAKKEAEQIEINKRIEAEELIKKQSELEAKAPIKKRMSSWVDGFSINEAPIKNDKSEVIKAKFEAFKKWAQKEIESI
jgi:hypothetical protein